LFLPLISDDYNQIRLGRLYGPVSGWFSLFNDVLYRCRATSLVMTYWTERWFGFQPFIFSCSSLLIHIVNTWLVWALGSWRVIGWRVSAIAAGAFAVFEAPQEAVVWYAALPELLVFTFSLLSFIAWVKWRRGLVQRWRWYWVALTLFLLALASKESAVAIVGLQAAAVLFDRRTTWSQLWWTLPFIVLAIIYAALIFASKPNHLHLNDGTFSLAAPFYLTAVRSVLRLMWIWGILALAVLSIWSKRVPRVRMGAIVVWAAITVLPYSFLTYMPRVPSRHLYLPSVAVCLLIAVAFGVIRRRFAHSVWIPVATCLLFILHNVGYLWVYKLHQFRQRAEVTERFLQFATTRNTGVIEVRCMPGKNIWTARDAAEVVLGRSALTVVLKAGPEPGPVHVYCDPMPDP